MRRLLLISLATFVLLTQWALAEHTYHNHADGDEQICELCLNHKVHSQALLATSIHIPFYGKSYIAEEITTKLFIAAYTIHYSVRAPPQNL